MVVDPNNNIAYIATCCNVGQIRVYDYSTATFLSPISLPGEDILDVAISADYAFVYAASYIAGTMRDEEFNIARPIAGVVNLGGITLLWSLIYFVVHYMENYKKKKIESLIWEEAVKDYELKTLKSQLNPHFMFNAMNSIRALIEEDPESAKVAITKLSNILRYSLQMERMESVPLEDEIETVKNYLDLERIRFDHRVLPICFNHQAFKVNRLSRTIDCPIKKEECF